MKNLSKLFRKIRTFLHMKRSDKRLLLEAFILTGAARALILIIPFRKLKNFIGAHREESPFEIEKESYITIKKIAWSVNVVSHYTPWKSKCFVQALTVQKMLKKRHIFCTIYFGINKDKDENIKAHAWTRCGEVFVTGGYEMNSFKEVARFSNAK